MRRRSVPVLMAALVAGALLAAGSPAAAQAEPDPAVAAETVLVTTTSAGALDRALADGGVINAADVGAEEVAARVAVAELTPEEAAAVAAAPGVLAVEPDAPVYFADQPNDPCYVAPGAFPATCAPLGAWPVDRIGLPGAWDLSHGGAGALVAVIDSGIGTVPELAGRTLPEIDATGGTAPCSSGPDMHHGSMVTSLIAAATNNGVGIPGVGWDTPVLPVRVAAGPTCNGTTLSRLLNGIALARNAGARILNISLSTASDPLALRSAIADAVAGGVVVVAAAGNSGSSSPNVGDGGYPAAYPEVLAVGATGTGDARSFFSNFGPWVDVYAPGEVIQTYDRFGTPVLTQGTSFSAPITAGVVSLLRAVRPGLSPAQISDILSRNADPVGGLGRLDARGALYDAVFGQFPAVGAGVHASGGGTEVVAGANDGTPMVRLAPPAAATRWQSLDGRVVGTPDTASSAPGRLDVVARGLDGAAYLRSRVGGVWGSWTSLGGRFSSDLSVASPAAGRLEVVGRGLDGALWHTSVVGGVPGAWLSLGGSLTSEPDLASWGSGRLDVFARGTDGAMWHRALDGSTWWPWESLAGGFLTGPGAVSVSVGTVHVSAVGFDGQMWMRHWDGARWVAWYPLGGQLTSSPDLVTRGPGTVEVYARAGDHQVWANRFNGSFSGWFAIS